MMPLMVPRYSCPSNIHEVNSRVETATQLNFNIIWIPEFSENYKFKLTESQTKKLNVRFSHSKFSIRAINRENRQYAANSHPVGQPSDGPRLLDCRAGGAVRAFTSATRPLSERDCIAPARRALPRDRRDSYASAS